MSRNECDRDVISHQEHDRAAYRRACAARRARCRSAVPAHGRRAAAEAKAELTGFAGRSLVICRQLMRAAYSQLGRRIPDARTVMLIRPLWGKPRLGKGALMR